MPPGYSHPSFPASTLGWFGGSSPYQTLPPGLCYCSDMMFGPNANNFISPVNNGYDTSCLSNLFPPRPLPFAPPMIPRSFGIYR